MTFEEMMALGLLPDGTNPAPPATNRDVLSEAHSIQLLLNAAAMERRHDGRYPFGNFYDGLGHNQYGVLPNLTGEGVFAGRVETMALPSPQPNDVLDIGQQVADLLGFDSAPFADDLIEDDEDFDPYYDASGVSTDPSLPLFDGSFTAPAASPMQMVPHGDTNPMVYDFDDRTISGLADALGPDVSSVARLGGPFAGYSGDQLTARLRELVRRA